MLTLHLAERTNSLASVLGQVLATPLDDPFAAEVVAVPAKGVERWLNQHLATQVGVGAAGVGDGIAANIRFSSPTRLVADALAQASDIDPREDQWRPSALRWQVLAAIDQIVGRADCRFLARHLDATYEHRAGRRFATADLVTTLLHTYLDERPWMLNEWTDGIDTDGAGNPLPEALAWQPVLWRTVIADIDQPSPAARLASACTRIAEDPSAVDLPDRLSLFGPTRLSSVALQVISSLSRHREVHLFVPHPSEKLWNRVAPLVTGSTSMPRPDTPITVQAGVRNRLLASLARDVCELQQRVMPLADKVIRHEPVESGESVLARLQLSLRNDLAPEEVVVDETCSGDRSVSVYSCHGPARQVEVLREHLLHLFNDDTSLDPRDVIVMCPDVERYAPLIRAAFGQVELAHPGHQLRVRLADRDLRQTNALFDVLEQLLAMSSGRVTASEVLDLIGSDPVRRRFRFSDDDIERIHEWVSESGIRWGLDTDHRARFSLERFPQNTFAAGLDRLLLGIGADESVPTWLGLALPLDDVDSNDIDVVGRFAECIDRLGQIVAACVDSHTGPQWRDVLLRGLEQLTDVRPDDAWQNAQVSTLIADVVESADDTTELALTDVRAMLRHLWAGRPTRANFRTGELTVCTMVPMRTVPHRVVVLLGVDDDIFPRSAADVGDDVLTVTPLVGERDRRCEDRQLLLDAVMSATEQLVVLYTGADPVTGQPRPPAVPISELIDAAAQIAGRDDVVTVTPLQPFSPNNFTAAKPFSFDQAALAGARELASGRPRTAPTLLAGPLPVQGGDVSLAELVAFGEHPVRAFLRQRLGFSVTAYDDEQSDEIDLELDGLARWNIGESVLAARLAGVSVEDIRATQWRRGTLPPGNLGGAILGRVIDDVENQMAMIDAGRPAVESETLDVSIDLPNGRRVTGSVPGVHGKTIVRTTYSSVGPRHRFASWVRLLAVAASSEQPSQWEAMSIGKNRAARAIAPDNAAELLADLVELRDDGLADPFPASVTAMERYAYLIGRDATPASALAAAKATFARDFDDAAVNFLYSDWDSMVGEPDADGQTRFGRLATRLWSPLLMAERTRR